MLLPLGRDINSVPSKDFSDEVVVEISQVSRNLNVSPKNLTSLYFEYRLRPPAFDLNNYSSEYVFHLDIDSTQIPEVFLKIFEYLLQNIV